MSTPKEDVEPLWTLLLVLVVFGIIGAVIWSKLRPEALEVLRYLRLFELWIISLFTNENAACIHWLRMVNYSAAPPSSDTVEWTQACFGAADLAALPADQSIQYYSLTTASVSAIGRQVSRYFHWFYAAAFAGVAAYLFFFSPRNKFKTHHNLESFIRVQAKMWPVIAPIVNFKPAKFSARAPGQMVPDKLPPFAEALSPEEWVAFHRIPLSNGIPEREAVRRAFLQQLGPRWNGVETAAPHVQALFAAFALKGTQKREDSDDLLGRIALCWDVKKGLQLEKKLLEEIKRLIRDPKVGGQATPTADQHAYRTTALLGTLKWARSMGGVLAPAQFVWLRAADRALWYPLNNLGRRSFHTEGAGAMAHFMAEQSAKKPLPIPRIDTAMVTLNKYLSESGMPIPPREEQAKPGRKGK
jgi:intracellular multiplication protein IcmP